MDFFKILNGGVGLGMSNFDRLFAEKHGGGAWQLTTLTGTLPLTFQSKGSPLTDYKLYGTSEGAGKETESGEPTGYKLPMTMESGETENLWDGSQATPVTSYRFMAYTFQCKPNTTYTMSQAYKKMLQIDIYADATKTELLFRAYNTYSYTFNSGEHNSLFFRTDQINANDDFRDSGIMLTEGSTPPDHYIPHRYESNYDLFIGSTKLGAEEYVDYGEQKVYRDIDGVLTPTDPPVPLPELSTYQGENTLSCSEGLGEVSITGNIKGE